MANHWGPLQRVYYDNMKIAVEWVKLVPKSFTSVIVLVPHVLIVQSQIFVEFYEDLGLLYRMSSPELFFKNMRGKMPGVHPDVAADEAEVGDEADEPSAQESKQPNEYEFHVVPRPDIDRAYVIRFFHEEEFRRQRRITRTSKGGMKVIVERLEQLELKVKTRNSLNQKELAYAARMVTNAEIDMLTRCGYFHVVVGAMGDNSFYETEKAMPGWGDQLLGFVNLHPLELLQNCDESLIRTGNATEVVSDILSAYCGAMVAFAIIQGNFHDFARCLKDFVHRCVKPIVSNYSDAADKIMGGIDSNYDDAKHVYRIARAH